MLQRDDSGGGPSANRQGLSDGLSRARARGRRGGLRRPTAGRRRRRRARWDAAGAHRRARPHARHGRLALPPARPGLRPDPVRLQPLGATRAEDRPGPRHRRRPGTTLGRPPQLHLPAAAGVRYAPPGNREVTAADFITAIQRLYDKQTPSYARQFADLIAGAKAFGAGKAKSISGLTAPDARTLTITLDQPAGDFLSILTMAYFAPVPGEYAAHYAVGANYDGHVVGSGPYTPTTYDPGRLIVLDRNPKWDPATDPLRKAWVDQIQITPDVSISSTRRAIEREEADLSLISHVPQTRVDALRADPEQSRRLSVNTTGSMQFLVLGTHRAAGAIADVRVRQAVNYAIDKVAYRDALAGRYAATGELASTILAPGSLGYKPYDLYPTRAAGATPSRPERCWPRPATPTG